MTTDPLDKLLHAADRTAPAPRLSTDIAERVRLTLLHEQRRATRPAALAAAAVLLIGLTATWKVATWPPVPPRVHETRVVQQTVTDQPDPRDARQLAALQARVESEIRVLLAAERQVRRRAAAPAQTPQVPPDPVAEARQTLREIAVVLLREADALEHTPGQRNLAIDRYERTVELFPDTPAATVARQRLAALKVPATPQGASS